MSLPTLSWRPTSSGTANPGARRHRGGAGLLIDEADSPEVAANDVRLDAPDRQLTASTDLQRYLRLHVAPDRRGIYDVRIAGEIGEWIGTRLLADQPC